MENALKSSDNQPALLPGGFYDLLPPFAEAEAQATHCVLDVFRSYGYARVKPPLAEFEENLLSGGPGAFLKDLAFRFMDPYSQKMLALRFDITAQIARIAGTRMARALRPLRLMYANDALRTRTDQQRQVRQFKQVGCELIGSHSVQADIEVAVLALQSLQALGLKGITLDLSFPALLHGICADYDCEPAVEAAILEAISRRDQGALRAAGHPLGVMLADVMHSSGSLETTITALRALGLGANHSARIDSLQQIADGLAAAIVDLRMDDVRLTLDPFELSGFEYHAGVCFALFCPAVRGELGRGGRYDLASGETACGLTLYMDSVMQAIVPADLPAPVKVDADESWGEIANRHARGEVIVRTLEE